MKFKHLSLILISLSLLLPAFAQGVNIQSKTSEIVQRTIHVDYTSEKGLLNTNV